MGRYGELWGDMTTRRTSPPTTKVEAKVPMKAKKAVGQRFAMNAWRVHAEPR